MAILSRDQLRSYTNWIGKSPLEVLYAVHKADGWHKVFPLNEPLPVWLHRVRNFFNETPPMLKRLPDKYEPAGRLPKAVRWTAIPNGLQAFALTGDVYVDPSGLPWFQMSTGGTPYHYPGKVNLAKKVDAAQKFQAFIPVFKLVSPDETGGSREIIIYNYATKHIPGTGVEWGENTLGAAGEWTDITYRTVFEKAYEGSYNYSETVIRGLDEHEHRDVKPHENYGSYYMTPVHPWTRIGERRFPAHAHQTGR